MSMLHIATEIATIWHCHQNRKDSVLPYIVHPMEVMKFCSTVGIQDQEVLAAAVLHDVLEDTGYTEEFLRRDCSKRVADIVVELTRTDNTKEGKNAYIFSFEQKSTEAVIIKCANHICNLWDFALNKKTVSYAAKYFMQAVPVFAVIADRRDTETDEAIRLVLCNILGHFHHFRDVYCGQIPVRNRILEGTPKSN